MKLVSNRDYRLGEISWSKWPIQCEGVNLSYQMHCSFDHRHGFLHSSAWILAYRLRKRQQPFISAIFTYTPRWSQVTWQVFTIENVIQHCWEGSDCLLLALLSGMYVIKIPSNLFGLKSPSCLSLYFCQILLLLCDLCGSLLDSFHHVRVSHNFRALLTWLVSLLAV